MNSRALRRMRGFVILMAAAACGPSSPGHQGAIAITPGPGTTIPLGATFIVPATFTDSSNQSPWTYAVSWGDGGSASGTTSTQGAIPASHAYTHAGVYRVDVTVTNNRGASSSASVTLTTGDPVILAAGDIGDCTRAPDEATGRTLDTIPGIVMPLGDNAYPNGTLEQYTSCYAPNWGRHKHRTRPVPGNHEYYTPGAAGYYAYFGAAAGDPAKGYYRFTAGDWLILVINTGGRRITYDPGSAQEQWLRAELASEQQPCALAVMHFPRFSTAAGRDAIRPEVAAIWEALYEYGVDLVLVGHDHSYQRFAPQKPDGTRDPAFGIRQITVGTGGGEGLYDFGPVPPGSNLEVRSNDTWGVLKLTLAAGSYHWRFVRSAGGTFTDSGTGTCHGRPM